MRAPIITTLSWLAYFRIFRSQTKKFVESVPEVLKKILSKEDADKLKSIFEALGAVVRINGYYGL